jgi:outer membrane protein assembly factor BamB
LLGYNAVAAEVDVASDWPQWRGPAGTGVVAVQDYPRQWNATEPVLWKTPIPGRGHSSPTVVGSRVYLTTADEQKETQSVLCLDRATGEVVWTKVVHEGGLDRKGNKKASQASGSVACDGDTLYVNFLNNDAVYTTALDLAGNQRWQTKVSGFVTHQGFGSSPMLYRGLAFVTTDSKGGGVVAALRCDDGKIAWSDDRPKQPNYASALVLKVAGKEQLLMSGCDLVSSFEPLTGKKLWEVPGATTECVTTIVSDGERVFVSGGYPRNHVQAIEADGSGRTAWENGVRVYVPSMIAHDGYLYAISDPGVAYCWNSATGKEMWSERLGGTYSSSLVMVGDEILATSESGETHIFKANPKKFERIAKNKLGDEVFATPSVCGGRVYHRVVEKKGNDRQEVLYCLGK